MKPTVTLLGTGGPRPDPARGATGLVIRYGEDVILIDAGRGTMQQLVRAGVGVERVAPVLITHHHLDHIGELADVMIVSWLMGRKEALHVYGPPETRRIVDALLTQVFDKDLEFRVSGEPANGAFAPVVVHEVMSGVVCETGRWRVVAEVVEHGDGLGFGEAFRRRWVCLGYRFECADGVIAFSGDTVDCEGLRRLARGADVLVQCCYLARPEIVGEHMERIARYTLASADTVGGIAARAGVGTLVLTHHRPKSEAALEEMRRDIAGVFGGRVVIGRDLLEMSC